MITENEVLWAIHGQVSKHAFQDCLLAKPKKDRVLQRCEKVGGGGLQRKIARPEVPHEVPGLVEIMHRADECIDHLIANRFVPSGGTVDIFAAGNEKEIGIDKKLATSQSTNTARFSLR